MNGPAFIDRHWTSPDGLQLHYRDYAGPDDRPPLLCIPGLTRNARDFEPLAHSFAGKWRMICADLRGRGDSDFARDPATYSAPYYIADIEALIDELALNRFVMIGTSLGGILTMLMAANHLDQIAGAVLNDIGPRVEQAGLERIGEYVGQGRSFPTWMHAARALQEQQGQSFPGYEFSDWLRLAKQLMVVSGNGRIVYDYDMKIAESFGDPAEAAKIEIWAAYKALAGRPVTVLRGAQSDILSAQTAIRMGRELPDVDVVTLAGVGHAPNLEEPEAQSAIARLLAKVA